MSTRQIFNNATQQLEDATLTVDANNEIIATFADDSFLKFPTVIVTETAVGEDAPAAVQTEPMTKAALDTLITLHQEHNEGKQIITPEVLAAQEAVHDNALALIDEENETSTDNGNTMPGGDQNDVPPTTNPET